MALIASGKAPSSVLAEITAREQRIQALEQELAETQLAQAPTQLDTKRLHKALSERLGRFAELVRADVPVARQALRKLLAEPMVLEPVDGHYRITGQTKLGALLDPNHIGMASPRGVEPLSSP